MNVKEKIEILSGALLKIADRCIDPESHAIAVEALSSLIGSGILRKDCKNCNGLGYTADPAPCEECEELDGCK